MVQSRMRHVLWKSVSVLAACLQSPTHHAQDYKLCESVYKEDAATLTRLSIIQSIPFPAYTIPNPTQPNPNRKHTKIKRATTFNNPNPIHTNTKRVYPFNNELEPTRPIHRDRRGSPLRQRRGKGAVPAGISTAAAAAALRPRQQQCQQQCQQQPAPRACAMLQDDVSQPEVYAPQDAG